jgi:hypothetical protein
LFFLSFLEIIAFQRLRMNIFTGKNIKKLQRKINNILTKSCLASIFTWYFKLFFPWFLPSEAKDICWHNIKLEDRSSFCFFVEYIIVFCRGVSIFNYQIIKLMKVLHFSQANHIHCRTLITILVGIKIKCYLIFTFARNNFISFLEIIAFQRLRMNIFTQKNIKKLHAQISLWRFKNTPSSCIGAVYVKK